MRRLDSRLSDALVWAGQHIDAAGPASIPTDRTNLSGHRTACTTVSQMRPLPLGISTIKVHRIGIGRLVLSYPDMPADVLAGRPLQRKRICRTFSDCTTAPRNGLVSGCYPLDEFYKEREEFETLKTLKKA